MEFLRRRLFTLLKSTLKEDGLTCCVGYIPLFAMSNSNNYVAIVVQLAPPCFLLGAVWFIPESPRWLLQKARKDDALKALNYMRHGAATPEEVEFELDLIDQAIQAEVESHRATSYVDCLKGSNARRTLIAVGVQCLQQAQGNSFMTTYLVIFLSQVGVGDPQLIACAKLCCSFAGTLLAFYLTDKIGRRPMLMGGSFFMAGLMWTISGVSSWTPGGASGSSAQGCIAAILFHVSISTLLRHAPRGY